MSQMTRYPLNSTYTLDAEADAAVISMENMAGGSVETTASQTIVVYGCNQDEPESKTFVAAEEEDSASVTMTITNARIRPLPSVCYNYRFIKLTDAAGGTVYLHRKS